MGIVSAKTHRINSQAHKYLPKRNLQVKTASQKAQKNLLSNVDHTLPAQNTENPLQDGQIVSNYNRNFVANGYLPANVTQSSTESYLNRTVVKRKSLILSEPLPSLDPTTAYFNTCPQSRLITDCCENPAWFYECASGTRTACVANRSNGAWVSAPVSYAAAVERCQQIKASLADGRNKVFSNQFQNSFR